MAELKHATTSVRRKAWLVENVRQQTTMTKALGVLPRERRAFAKMT